MASDPARRPKLGVILLLTGWVVWLLSLFLPAYHGEFMSPGPTDTHHVFVAVYGAGVGLIGMATAAETSLWGMISLVAGGLMIAGFFAALFAPLAICAGIARRPWLLTGWAVVLLLKQVLGATHLWGEPYAGIYVWTAGTLLISAGLLILIWYRSFEAQRGP